MATLYMKFTILVDTYFAIITIPIVYPWSMSGSREEECQIYNTSLLYVFYGHALAEEYQPRGSCNLKMFLILGHHYYILNLSEPFREVEKKKTLFYTFYPKIIPSPLGRGVHKINNFLSSNRCYTPNLVIIGPVVLEKEMLTADARRTTTVANPWQHITWMTQVTL